MISNIAPPPPAIALRFIPFNNSTNFSSMSKTITVLFSTRDGADI
jgi:hypothetical protein